MTPAYTLSHLAEPEAVRLHADHPDTLTCAFTLCLPRTMRRRLTPDTERVLLSGLRHSPERGQWAHGDWTLTRLGEE